MQVTRIFHRRAPLVVRQFVGKKEYAPYIDHSKADGKGGCTVVVTGDLANPGEVKVQVGWCRFTDPYNRKMGVKTAMTKEAEVVQLRDLPHVLAEIEDQMLCQFNPFLRHNGTERDASRRDWNFAVRYFLPKTISEVACAC